MQELLSAIPSPAPAIISGVILLSIFIGSTLLRRFVDRLTRQGHLQGTMAARLHVIRRAVLILITPLILLQTIGLVEHAWTLISTLLATLAIGFFAVWSLLTNATSALILLTFRPFRIGDLVDLVEPSNGTTLSGRVEDMNLMFTTLKELPDPPQRAGPTGILHVPNSLFFQKAIRVRPTPYSAPADTPFFAPSQVPQPPSPSATVTREPAAGAGPARPTT